METETGTLFCYYWSFKAEKISTFGKVNLVKFRITVNTVPAQSFSLK